MAAVFLLNQPVSRLSSRSRAAHSSWAASPRVSVSVRPASAGSTPQVDRLAADWAAQAGASAAKVWASTSVTDSTRSSSTAASAVVMESSARNTTRPSSSVVPWTRPHFRAEDT